MNDIYDEFKKADKVLNTDYIVEGSKVYDPRDKTYKLSTNPALVIADLIGVSVTRNHIKGLKIDDNFWHIIGELADYVERPIVNPSFKDIYCDVNCFYFSRCHLDCALYHEKTQHDENDKLLRIKQCIDDFGK